MRRFLDLGRSGNEVQGLGRFSLDAVHTYDSASRTLYRGDGSRRRGDAVTSTLEAIHFKAVNDVVWDSLALPDGGVLMSLASGLYRRGPDGTDTKLAPHVSDGCISAFEIPALQSCYAKLLSDLALGPDGSLYATTDSGSRILRIRPSGIVSHVAGVGPGGETGDGGLATSAFVSCRSLAVGSDGAVYCGGNSTIRRIGPEGTIRTVAGGPGTVIGNDIPAAQAWLGAVIDMTFLRDGSLLVASSGLTTQLRKIGTDGVIRCVAGCGGGSYADGQPALTAGIEAMDQLAEGPDGTIYFTARVAQLAPNGTPLFRNAIRTIGTDGLLGTVAGLGGPQCQNNINLCGVGGPALSANFDPRGLSIGAGGKLFGHTPQLVFGLSADLPSFARSGFVVTEADARTAYLFDAQGRHLQTFDAETGVILLTIAHDDEGRFVSLTDSDGLVTTVTRDAAGTPLQIVGPYGHRTELSLDENGYLNRIEDPEGGAWIADYDDLGLMLSWTNRNGHQKTLTWDSGGRLLSVTDAALATTTLIPTTTETGRVVTLESALGRARSYGLERAAGPSEIRTFTGADGLTTTTTRNGSGVATSVAPDGTTTSTQLAPDPRFGLAAPYISRETVTLPSGLTVTLSRERSVTLAQGGGDFDFVSRTDTLAIDGRTWTITHDGPTREVATTSPEGRIGVELLDADGRVIEIQDPGALPITIDYDLDGRPSQVQQGARATTFTYGADGLLAAVTDPLGRTTSFTRDAVGRVLQERRPDLEATLFAYDLEGNATTVTPPGRPAHGMTHNLVELLESYDPPALPGGGPTSYSYDLDRALTAIEEPGPRLTEHHYDAAGRHIATTFPGGAITLDYDPVTGHLVTVDGPDAAIHYSYDGARLTSVTTTGAVAGEVSWEHDSALRLTEERIDGAHSVTFDYDADDLLLQAGALTFLRDPTTGFATQATAGAVVDTWTYDPYADVATATATVAGLPLLQTAYLRDDLGRITEQTETTASGTRVLSYEYDELDRLRAVYEDGLLSEAYDYDLNGNRVASLNDDGDADATYDTRDRLLTQGAATFTWAPTGELQTKTESGATTTYSYDALGNLKAVELGDGTVVEYKVDAQGRRVQRLLDGVPERGWIWRSALQPAAQLSPGGAVTQRYVYTNGTSPALIVTPGASYRLIKDHLGSVRRVVDTATGEVVQTLDYDAWGRVLVDSNPGFQPFGYAGGLYDADTGLVRFGARDYDPETGTWLTPEPLGFAAGDNFYAYAAGNPVAYNDPTGLAPSRAELTFLAELFGVGSTASMINERDASIEAVSHGDIGKAECHAAAAASASVGAVVEIGMLAATRGGGARQTGSYTNLHKSGKKYHGKGPRSRSQKSGRRVERETGDPHIGTEWSPASSEREAFKQESRRIDQDGGWDSPLNYNRKESPGKRLRRDDGEFP
ncbi:MAG: hypothetical protein IPG04_35390 [Polyangiaceae bacterium]|nr:hypothetical protein [Polyangiaceae bacterium]